MKNTIKIVGGIFSNEEPFEKINSDLSLNVFLMLLIGVLALEELFFKSLIM